MCNLSTSVYSKGYDKGILVGALKRARKSAYEMRDIGEPIDKIARAIKFNVDFVQR